MRVAVCFSGMPRSFKTVYESHKKFIFDVLSEQGIEYDIFIHTWNNKVKYPIILFPVLKTLVAPMLPEPISLISLFKKIFVKIKPKGTDPIK